jgi:hypothetical protein
MEKGNRQIEALSNFAMEQDVLNVPAYFLYGEDWTKSIFGFFHIEALSVRNVPNNWGIASHRHLDFDQMSILFTGSSTFKHDGQQGAAEAPSCVYTPANVVHQFSYSPSSIGFVISFSSDFVAGLPSIDGAPNAAILRLARNRVIALQTETQIATVQGLVELLAERSSSIHRNQPCGAHLLSAQLTKSTSEIRDAFSVYDVEAGVAKNRVSLIDCSSAQEATYGETQETFGNLALGSEKAGPAEASHHCKTAHNGQATDNW